MNKSKGYISLTMFDLLKGLGIIGVVIGHSGLLNSQVNMAVKMLIECMMPVFFIISGYWMKKKKLSKGVKYSARYLLLPYLYTGISVIIVAFILKLIQFKAPWEWMRYLGVPFVAGFSIASGTTMFGMDFGWNGAAWFLLALFWGWIFFFAIMSIKKESVRIISVILCECAGCILCSFSFQFFGIAVGLISVGYVYFGYFLKKKEILNKKLNIGIYILCAVVWILGAKYGHISIASLHVKNGLVDIVCTMCGAFLVICLFLRINTLSLKIFKPFMTIGRYSNWILCIHTVEMLALPWDKILGSLPSIALGSVNVVLVVLRGIIIFATCVVLRNRQKITNFILRKK